MVLWSNLCLALLCCSCSERGTPAELPVPLPKSPLPTDSSAGQSRHPGLAAPAHTQPRAHQPHTMMKGGQLGAPPPSPATTAFARGHLAASCERQKHDIFLILSSKHRNKHTHIPCYGVISYQQRRVGHRKPFRVHFHVDSGRTRRALEKLYCTLNCALLQNF